MPDSNWATTGKRWLPLSEVLKQAPGGDRVTGVVIYEVNCNGYGNRLCSSLEKAQATCMDMTRDDALEWEQSGRAPNFGWTAKDERGTTFGISSLVIETNPLFEED